MLYHAYEMTHAAISPMRAAARMGQEVISNPLNPMAMTYGSRALSAALEMFINATRRYGKPAFGIETTPVDGVDDPGASRRWSGRRPSATCCISAATPRRPRRATTRRC